MEKFYKKCKDGQDYWFKNWAKANRKAINLLDKIDKAIERCKQEISASSIQYEREHKQQHLVYKVAHERMLNILQKGDSNEN